MTTPVADPELRKDILADYPHKGMHTLVSMEPLTMLLPRHLVVGNLTSKKLMTKEGRDWCKEHIGGWRTQLKFYSVVTWHGDLDNTLPDLSIFRPSKIALPIIMFESAADMFVFQMQFGYGK